MNADDYRILIAIDLKTGTDRLLAEATRYAKALNAVVDVIHVSDLDALVGYIKTSDPGEDQSLVDSGRELRAKALRTEHQQTQAFGASLQAGGVRVGQALTVQGPVLATILAHASKLNSNLLMLGSNHHGTLYRLWYGDIATGAAKQAPCALLVVPV